MDLRRPLALTVASVTVAGRSRLRRRGAGGLLGRADAVRRDLAASHASAACRAGRAGPRLPRQRQPDRRLRGRPEHRWRDLLGPGRAGRRGRRGSASTTGRGSARARRSRRPTRTPGRAARPTRWPRRSPRPARSRRTSSSAGPTAAWSPRRSRPAIPTLTAGLVLEDSSVPQQFVDKVWDDIDWEDGGRVVDEQLTLDEIGTVDFGDLPVRGAHPGPAAEAARGARGAATRTGWRARRRTPCTSSPSVLRTRSTSRPRTSCCRRSRRSPPRSRPTTRWPPATTASPGPAGAA